MRILSIIFVLNFTFLPCLSAAYQNNYPETPDKKNSYSNTAESDNKYQLSDQDLSILKLQNRLDHIEAQISRKNNVLMEDEAQNRDKKNVLLNNLNSKLGLLTIFSLTLGLCILLIILYIFRSYSRLNNLKKDFENSIYNIEKLFLSFKEESNNLLIKNISLFEKDFKSKAEALENSIRNLETTTGKAIQDLKFRNEIVNKFLTTYKLNVENKLKDIKNTLNKIKSNHTHNGLNSNGNYLHQPSFDITIDDSNDVNLDSVINTIKNASKLNIEIPSQTFLKIGNLLFSKKRFGEALYFFQELEKRMDISSETNYYKACCLAFLGRKDNMLKELKIAISDNPLYGSMALKEEAFRKFHDDPVFLAIINAQQ